MTPGGEPGPANSSVVVDFARSIPPLTRRQFLSALGSAGAAAFLASYLPGVVDRAWAASEAVGPGSLADIDHFVFLMQENRSFDHYFGSLSGVRGFDDPTALPGVFRQYGYQVGKGVDPTGSMLPFAFVSDLTHDDQCLNDPTHDWGPQHQCWNNGKMDQWLTTHCAVDGAANGPIVMGYYTRQTLPYYYQLADAFTVCDHYHCSVLGPTYPNRAYWMSGTLDPDGLAGGPILATLSNVLPDPASWGYLRWKTMPEVLQEAGITWKVYQSTDAVGGIQGGLLMDNILRLFKQYSNPGPLFDNGLLPTLEVDFPADVASGRLPQVSWIVTDFTQCEHPAAPPSYGGLASAYVLDLLSSNPELWAKTVFIINYDENGGFFDHVPPPTAPPGTPGEWVTRNPPVAAEGSTDGFDGPIGLGFRVPCLVISPYSRGGLVYSGVLDHTSQLKLLETRFGVTAPNLTAWRRAAVGDFTGAFDFASTPDPSRVTVAPVLDPYLAVDLANAGPATAGDGIPYPYPAQQEIFQEPGTRRQPSGPVAAAAPPPAGSATNPSHVPPASVSPGAATAASPAAAEANPAAASERSASGSSASIASGADPSAAQGALAQTGSDVAADVVKGAGLVTLGVAVSALARELPFRRQGLEGDSGD
jgi:phospholipase C